MILNEEDLIDHTVVIAQNGRFLFYHVVRIIMLDDYHLKFLDKFNKVIILRTADISQIIDNKPKYKQVMK
jgi:hypothetical protein